MANTIDAMKTTTTTMKRSISCITTNNNLKTTETTAVVMMDKNSKRKKFEIPLNADGSISPIDEETKLSEKEGLNILVVDDNPINITILKKCLYKINTKFQIKRLEEASNGIEALHLLNLHHFDLILLDIDMPILNGIDTAKCIRKKGQMTPIIAVTTNDSIECRNNYIEIGMNDCLSKPVNLQLLEQTLFKVLLLLPDTSITQQLITPTSPTNPKISTGGF